MSRSTGCGEAWMGIADDEGEAMKPSGLKRGQKVAPVNLGLAEGGADTENGAFPIGADPDGDENGAVQELAALSDFFVSGVQDHVGIASERAIAPGLEFGIEFGGGGADLGGTNGMPAEFLDDFGNFAGRDALDIHLGQREHEGSFAANAFFEGAGIKAHAVANLGDAELDGADTGGEGFWFEPVGAAQAAIAPLVGTGLKDGAALLSMASSTRRRRPSAKPEEPSEVSSCKTVFRRSESMWLVMCVFLLDVFCRTPTGNHTGQLPANFAQARSGADCVRLATLAFTPSAPERALRS